MQKNNIEWLKIKSSTIKILRHQMYRKSAHFLSLKKKKKRVFFHHTYEPFSKASMIANYCTFELTYFLIC